MTVALPFEEGNAALAAGPRCSASCASGSGSPRRPAPRPTPRTPRAPLLFHLERGFGAPRRAPARPDESLVLLRSAGERGEAEAIAAEVAKLIAAGADPARSRSPCATRRGAARRSPRRWRPTASPTALEAELPVAATAVGGALIALLEAEFGSRAGERPAALPARALGRLAGAGRLVRAAVRRGTRPGRRRAALELWKGERRQRAAATWCGCGRRRPLPGELAAEVGRLAATMASRPLRGGRAAADRRRARAAGRRGDRRRAWPSWRRARRAGARAPRRSRASIAGIAFRVWSGPVEGRVRIASPYRLRAGRFDHVFVASLQDGEFPRRDRGGDPFLSEAQR